MESKNKDFQKNPLLCPVCNDYFVDPKILQCFHTVCARCLTVKLPDNNIICPICKRANNKTPLHDFLIEHLIESINLTNPICSNCDKRDQKNMFFCKTCNQALCQKCRNHTHRAKMFAKHDIQLLEKDQAVLHKQTCQHHGEMYTFYSPNEKLFLCAQCFRESGAERRSKCTEVDSAYQQAMKKIDFTQQMITELQNSIRDGIFNLKSSLDELKINFESEKTTINTFCLGMQESISKTHSSLMIDIQKQFEGKESQLRQKLLSLGDILPIMFTHLSICSIFMSSSSKFSILKYHSDLIDRLIAVAQLSEPAKDFLTAQFFLNVFILLIRIIHSNNICTKYRTEFAKSLEPWIFQELNLEKCFGRKPTKASDMVSKVTNVEVFKMHCQRFEDDVKSFSHQISNIKNELNDVNRDLTILHQANSIPLIVRFETIERECSLMDDILERQQQEFDRLANLFETMWNDQLWRMRAEREIFTCQMSEILNMRNELKYLNVETLKLEPLIRSLGNQTKSMTGDKKQKYKTNNRLLLNNLLEKFMKTSETSSLKRKSKKSTSVADINRKAKPPLPARNSSLKETSNTLKPTKVYPYSDGEDNLKFYKKQNMEMENSKKNSIDSSSTFSGNSSPLMNDNKTSLFYVNSMHKKPKMKNMRSWDTFPPSKHRTNRTNSMAIVRKDEFDERNFMYKTDSFEGHEEAVKTLVAAVQETRIKPKNSSTSK